MVAISITLTFVQALLRLPASLLLKTVYILLVVYGVCDLDGCLPSVVMFRNISLWAPGFKSSWHLVPEGSFQVGNIYPCVVRYPCDCALGRSHNFLAWCTCCSCMNLCDPWVKLIVCPDVYFYLGQRLPPLPPSCARICCFFRSEPA